MLLLVGVATSVVPAMPYGVHARLQFSAYLHIMGVYDEETIHKGSRR